MAAARPSSRHSETRDTNANSTGGGSGNVRPSGVHRKAPPATPADPEQDSSAKAGASKWTTMDQFVHSGFRYQLRRRPVEPRGDAARLSEREELVVAQAVAGLTNKGIACNLGVSPSTVGVLLYRAATKLGVRSRSELLAAYKRRRNLGDGSNEGA
jgi:DNA-binding CsgD family transcriptional regulator